MKSIIFSVCLLLSCFFVANADNNANISYFPVVVGKDMPQQSVQLLNSRMEQVLTNNGYGAMNNEGGFIMLAKCNVIEKDIAPTTPPRISQKVEVTFILGDAAENRIYASGAIELSGIGVNETKVWQTAINGINPSNPIFRKMFDEALEKISAYYTANCENLITKALTLGSKGESDEAIALLMNIPDICSEPYEKAMTVMCEIYRNKVNEEGRILLAKANNAWSVSPDGIGAEKAMSFLNGISIYSASFPEAQDLAEIISKKLSQGKEREWQLKIQQYNDEKEFRTRQQANSYAYSMAAVAAARSVGEKWAENQPETKVYLNW